MSNSINPVAGGGGDGGGNASDNALFVGAHVGDFEVKGIIGEGGFGIVYEAFDHTLHRRVALKEYMPKALAKRKENASVAVRSEHHEQAFAAGLKSFVNEARLLAQFDHPALVKVFRFWEQNATAYMVMPLYEGRTLKDVLREGPRPDEAWLKATLAPLLDALEALHAAQCYHRDISPDNVLILNNGGPLLLDFGAARKIISDLTQAVTVILKPGYAPIEQYADDATMKQGPWTDIYALCGVLHLAVIGKPPPTSVTRIVSDSMKPLAEAAGGYSPEFLAALDRGLTVRPEGRPQSIAEFRHLLGMRTWAPAVTQFPPPRLAAPKSSAGKETVAARLAPPPASGTSNSFADAPTELAITGRPPPRPAVEPRPAPSSASGNPRDLTATLPLNTRTPIPAMSTVGESARPGNRRLLVIAAAAVLAIGVGAVLYMAGVFDRDAAPAATNTAAQGPTSAASTQGAMPTDTKPEGRSSTSPAVVGDSSGARAPVVTSPAPPPSPAPQATPVVPETTPAPAAPPPAPVPAPPSAPPVAAKSEVASAVEKAPAVALPAPTPPAAPSTGRISLAIKPWGGIYVNGQPQGVSPPKKNLDLPEGRYTLEIRNTGFPSLTREVEVRAGRTITVEHAFR